MTEVKRAERRSGSKKGPRKTGRIGTMIRQEFVVAARSRFYLFILIILAVSVAAVYLIPEEFTLQTEVYLFDSAQTEESRALAAALGSEILLVGSADELREKVAERGANQGYRLEVRNGGLEVIYVHNGEISPKELRIRGARLEALYRTIDGRPLTEGPAAGEAAGKGPTDHEGAPVRVRTMQEQAPPLGNSMRLLIILLAFEVVVIGYLFSAVVIFQEKQEGTVKAYRVTPGGTGVYIISKSLFWASAGVIYGGLMLAAATRGNLGPPAWLHIMSAVLMSSFFYSLVGIGIAVYFTTISEWFMVGIGILVINMLPLLALEFPTLSIGVLEWIPSHPFLFWVRTVIRQSAENSAPAGLSGWWFPMAGRLGLFILAGAVFASLSVRFRIMKES
jgi:ABC-2 type transport system permease protein/fluoroquinolone transport system permease protein